MWLHFETRQEAVAKPFPYGHVKMGTIVIAECWDVGHSFPPNQGAHFLHSTVKALPNYFLWFSSVAQSLSHVQLFVTPWTAAHQASLSITNFRSLPKLMSIKSVMPSNHLILCRPFSFRLQSFTASGSFLVSQFFLSGGQSIGVSASTSVLPMNIQD